MLKASDVPTGMKEADGFENGHWVVEPDTASGVIKNLIYTYRFDLTQQHVNEADVTFRIIDGTWDGVDKTDKYAVITLTNANSSPAINNVNFPTGMIPDRGYANDGSWVNTTSPGANGRLQILCVYTFKKEAPKPQNPSESTDPSKPSNPQDPAAPSTPNAATNEPQTNVVETGDNSSILLYVLLMVLSSMAVAYGMRQYLKKPGRKSKKQV